MKSQVLRRARPWSGLHTSHFTLQTPPKAGCAKQSQTWEDWGMWAEVVIVRGPASLESGTCETKPIRGGRDGQPRTDLPRPSFPRPLALPWPRYKQSQLSGKMEEVGRDARPTKSRSCETKPISDGAGGTPACTNKPNWPPPGRGQGRAEAGRKGWRGQGNRAKQSQFGRPPAEGQVPHGERVMTNRTLKGHPQNKANLPPVRAKTIAKAEGLDDATQRDERAKQSQMAVAGSR